MKRVSSPKSLFALLLWFFAAPFIGQESLEPVAVVIARNASSAAQFAADELKEKLQQIYPAERFIMAGNLPPAGRAIIVASKSDSPEMLAPYLAPDVLSQAESFLVTHRNVGARKIGIIAGADARGASHGVYALLEKLGCGFYLSHDTEPAPRRGPLTFDGWDFADAPLFGDRIVLNWHNFLSSPRPKTGFWP